jgi:hypothetical protein
MFCPTENSTLRVLAIKPCIIHLYSQSPNHPTAPPMPRTSYKADFIREINELLTLAYVFELLFDETDFIPFELVILVNKYIIIDRLYRIQVELTPLRGFPFIQILLCQSPSGLIVHLCGFHMRPLDIRELIEDLLCVSGSKPIHKRRQGSLFC